MFLLTLLFGIVDTSFLLKDWLSVTAAARAGARMGSSQPRLPNFATDSAAQVTNAIAGLNPADLEAVWVYRTTPTAGLRPGSCNAATRCVPFTWNGTRLTTTASANWPSTTQNACGGDSNRDALGVYVQYRHTSPVGFFFNPATVSESTVMWVEPTPAIPCRP